MKKKIFLTSLIILILNFSVYANETPAQQNSSANEQKYSAQQKVLAMNAAEADALAKLSQEIKGTWVKGFDLIRNAAADLSLKGISFESFVKGAKIGKPNEIAPGLYECEGAITINQFVENIKHYHKEYNKGKNEDFDSIVQKNNKLTIRVKGFGAVKDSLLPKEPKNIEEINKSEYDSKVSQIFSKIKKLTAQQKLMAKTAAEADALVKLAREVKGTWVFGNDLIKNAFTEDSIRKIENEAFIKGAKFIDFDLTEDGMCEAVVQVTLKQFIENTKQIYNEYSKGNPEIFDSILKTEKTIVIKAAGRGVGIKDEEPSDNNNAIQGEIK